MASSAGKLDGRVVWITGASRGQGEAEARLCVDEGASVVLGDVLDAEGELVAESLGDAARYVHHDVSDAASWQTFAETATRRYGRVDALVNNAGIMVYKPLEDMTLEEYRRVVDVNQVGCFLGMKAVIPGMRAAGGGAIVNLTDWATARPYALHLPYFAAKAGLEAATKGLARALAPEVRVNAVAPGPILLPEGASADLAAAVRRATPLGRLGGPEAVATAVLFLLGHDFMTGEIVRVDGGRSLK